jgi:hypothetical protein
MEVIIAKNQTRIFIAKEPNEIFGSFTILKPTIKYNLAAVFYQTPKMNKIRSKFFVVLFNRQSKIPEHDAKAAAVKIVEILKRYMSF